MTYELNLKCIWQHPTTGNHLEITKIVWGEVEKPIIITVRNLRLAQPGTWKKHIKQDTEALINLLSSLVEFTKFSFFTKSHPLQKQLVEELILFCQSLTLSTGQSSPKRQKNYLLELQLMLENPNWHFFDNPVLVRRPFLMIGSIPTSFMKISASFF